MKSTGVIRKIDELGRVVIPKEIRTKLKLDEKDPVEIYIDGRAIILKKVETNCIFCGNGANQKLVSYKDKLICNNCLEDLSSNLSIAEEI